MSLLTSAATGQQFASALKPGLILCEFQSRWRAAPRELLRVTETAVIVAACCQQAAREKLRLFIHEPVVQREQRLLWHNRVAPGVGRGVRVRSIKERKKWMPL